MSSSSKGGRRVDSVAGMAEVVIAGKFEIGRERILEAVLPEEDEAEEATEGLRESGREVGVMGYSCCCLMGDLEEALLTEAFFLGLEIGDGRLVAFAIPFGGVGAAGFALGCAGREALRTGGAGATGWLWL
jgi:hypothetical protein